MNTVIYHRADYDGLFSREAARHWLTQLNAGLTEFIGWDFGDPLLSWPSEGTIYVLDLPIDRVFGSQFSPLMKDKPVDPLLNRLVWIDHHKSSIDSHPEAIPGYRIDGVAACRLTWQWFQHIHDRKNQKTLPDKTAFVERTVIEPLAIRLAGEYDVWDHRDPRGKLFQFGLDTEIAKNPVMFQWLLDPSMDNSYTTQIVAQGQCAAECYRQRDAEIMRHRSFLADFEGLKLLCLNTARCSSSTFDERDKPETGHDALCGFWWNGKEWNVSLYHAKHRTDIDLSVIASKHGGGGHRGACGFRTKVNHFRAP